MRKEYLPYARHWVGDEEIKAITDVLRSDFITSGPKIDEFEKEMAGYIGCKRVIATSSCTGALHICLTALKIKPGDEVITSDLTFAATPSVPLFLKAKPVVVDIYKDTYNINPEEIKKNITARTKVIIPVHYAGQPCEMDEIIKIARENNLEIIEDAAHAISAEYKGKKIGNIDGSRAACFSFHPIKNMTMGEGGIIATNDEKFADKCKLIRLHGLDKYKMVALGYKYTINEIQAALGLVQLKKLEFFEDRRKKYAEMYLEAFRGIPEISCPVVRSGVKSSWHLFVIRLDLDKIDRDKFRDALKAENIGTQIHFVPIHLQPYFQKRFSNRKFPATEEVYNSMVSLPLFPKMEEQDVMDVIEAVKKNVEHYK